MRSPNLGNRRKRRRRVSPWERWFGPLDTGMSPGQARHAHERARLSHFQSLIFQLLLFFIPFPPCPPPRFPAHPSRPLLPSPLTPFAPLTHVATVYASVAVVSGDDKSGAWLEDDDTMAWGDDKIPIQMRGA